MASRLLAGKTGAVFGVANRHSLAWHVARAWRAAGADVAIGFQERSRAAVEAMVAADTAASDDGGEGGRCKPPLLFACDVTRDADIDDAFARIGAWAPGARLDALLHAVAAAPTAALRRGGLVAVTRDEWHATQDVSAYSLVALARGALPLMASNGDDDATNDSNDGNDGNDSDGGGGGGGSILALSYLGAERVVPSYGVLGPAKAALESAARYLAHDLGPAGVRVNCVSAGPVRTASARALPGFAALARGAGGAAPLGRNATADEVARAAVFLASDLASGVTGEVLKVDGGFSTMATAATADVG